MMEVRELRHTDMKEWVALVAQLSPKASLGTKTERSAFVDLTGLQEKAIFVVEEDGKLIGTASVLLEIKVNRGTAKSGNLFTVAHVEEVVVDSNVRGMGIGKLLMDRCVEYAKSKEAYKVILDCSEENVEFYEKCGFEKYEVCMRISI